MHKYAQFECYAKPDRKPVQTPKCRSDVFSCSDASNESGGRILDMLQWIDWRLRKCCQNRVAVIHSGCHKSRYQTRRDIGTSRTGEYLCEEPWFFTCLSQGKLEPVFGGGMPFHTNQLGLGKRHWNLETSSAVVVPPPYHNTIILSYIITYWYPHFPPGKTHVPEYQKKQDEDQYHLLKPTTLSSHSLPLNSTNNWKLTFSFNPILPKPSPSRTDDTLELDSAWFTRHSHSIPFIIHQHIMHRIFLFYTWCRQCTGISWQKFICLNCILKKIIFLVFKLCKY